MELVVREARPEDAGPIVAVLNPFIESGLYTVFDAPLTEEAERGAATPAQLHSHPRYKSSWEWTSSTIFEPTPVR
jgi:hypothetical protein